MRRLRLGKKQPDSGYERHHYCDDRADGKDCFTHTAILPDFPGNYRERIGLVKFPLAQIIRPKISPSTVVMTGREGLYEQITELVAVMPEPVTHTTAAVAIAAPVAAAASTLAFGITAWPFGVAFVAGCIALIYLPNMALRSAAASIFGSTVIAGLMSQILAAPLLLIASSRWFPELQPWAAISQVPATAGIALILGLICQKAVPWALTKFFGGQACSQP
jgi:hypothetical protein